MAGEIDRDDIVGSEGRFDHILRDLRLVSDGGRQRRVPVHIGALVGEVKPCRGHQQEQRRDHPLRGIGESSHKGDLRDQVLVLCLHHQIGEKHQEPRHQGKHRHQADQDRFCERGAEIRSQSVSHKQKRQEA